MQIQRNWNSATHSIQ